MNMSVVRLIVATRSSGPAARGKIIKEMSGLVASGTPYIIGLNCLGVSYNHIRMSTQKENYRLVYEIYERFVRITNAYMRNGCQSC